MIVGFDPTARLAITDAAQAAYLASGLQNQPGMPATLSVLGGPIYANDAGQSGAAYEGRAMWMPRASASYLIGDRTVLKGGYGLYYDTLNASDYVAAQAGYSVTTTSTISDDLGRTFKWATPATGAGSFDPFPVRADGTRWDPVVGDALGVNSLLGGALNTENGLRDHARQQRWRVSLQRQLSSNLGVEVAYAGAYNDELPVTIRQDYLPEQYWDGSNTRNTAANTYLTAQVPNPYFINNFALLRTTDPVLYQRLASNPDLLVGDDSAQPPAASVRPHDEQPELLQPAARRVEVAFARGAAESPVQQRAQRLPVVHRQPRALQPHRRGVRPRADALAGEQRRTSMAPGGSRQLRAAVRPRPPVPAGRRRAGGAREQLAGDRHLGIPARCAARLGTRQNIFFNGDLDDIALDDPTREEWFNIDAGFERDPARIPAAFQKRAFPFRIDGVRGMPLTFTNLSIQRNFGAGNGRTWQLRMDAQNVFNRQQWQGPTLNPTSTQFGQVTNVALNQMRFFTFGARMTF